MTLASHRPASLLTLAALVLAPAASAAPETPRDSSRVLVEQRRTETSIVEDRVAALVDRAVAQPQQAEAVAAELLLMDRNDAALDVLLAAGRNALAFELLAGELRYAEALALPADEKSPELLFGRARLLARVGEREASEALLAQLAASSPKDALSTVTRAIREQSLLVSREVALGTAAGAMADAGANAPWPVLSALWPTRAPEASAAWTWLAQQDPKAPAGERLARVAAILDPSQPSAEAELFLAQGAATAARQGACAQGRSFEGLVGVAELRGREDVALALAKHWAEATGSGAAWMRVGELLADRELWKDAAAAFGKAAEALPAEGTPTWMQADMLRRAGDERGAAQLRARAEELTQGNEGAVYRLAFAMERAGEAEAAIDLREKLLHEARDAASPILLATAELLGSRASCGKSYAAAVGAFDRARDLALSQPTLTLDKVLCLVRSAQRAEAHAALQAGRLDEALALAEHALAPFVSDADLAADLVRALDAAGRKAEAEDFLARVSARFAEAADSFPTSAQLQNGRAWLAARSGRDLDAGLASARAAVALEPDNAAFQDTLAEVLFQLGDRVGALEAARQALALEPDRAYLQQQLVRIEAGDAFSRPPVETP